jgi:hypothetical protein
MDNAIRIVAELDILERRAKGRFRLTAAEVLGVAASLKTIDAPTRGTIQTVSKMLPELRKILDSLSANDREELDEVYDLVRGSSSITVLKRNLDRVEKRHKGMPLAAGAALARKLFADGEKTIYDPKNPFHSRRGSGRPFAVFSTVGVAAQDAGGAVVGGALGSFAGLAAAAAAAAVAAVSASTQQVVADVIEDLAGEDDVPLFEDIDDIVPPPT